MKKLLTRFVAVLAASAAAALGLLADPMVIPRSDATPPWAVQPRLDIDLPGYPGAQEVDIGEGILVNGQRVDMRQFFTDEAPEVVAEFYEDAFNAAQPDGVTRYRLGNADYVGFINDQGRFVQVMILDAGDGSTLVMPNVASGPLRPGNEAKGLPVPLPPDHNSLMTYRSVDGGRVAISAQFRSELDMLEIAEFYRRELPPLGFTQRSGALAPAELGENGVMRFVRPGGPYVTIGAQQLADGAGSLVYLLAESGGEAVGP